MTPRARALRWSMVCAVAAGLVVIFPTWSTFWCLFLLSATWIAGTCAGIMTDEYFPRDRAVRDWTPPRRRIAQDWRRWR